MMMMGMENENENENGELRMMRGGNDERWERGGIRN